MLLQGFGQFERILAGTQRAIRNLQFEIQLPELKVRTGQVGHQRGHHFFLRPLIGQKDSARRFGRPPVATPEIQVPGGRG